MQVNTNHYPSNDVSHGRRAAEHIVDDDIEDKLRKLAPELNGGVHEAVLQDDPTLQDTFAITHRSDEGIGTEMATTSQSVSQSSRRKDNPVAGTSLVGGQVKQWESSANDWLAAPRVDQLRTRSAEQSDLGLPWTPGSVREPEQQDISAGAGTCSLPAVSHAQPGDERPNTDGTGVLVKREKHLIIGPGGHEADGSGKPGGMTCRTGCSKEIYSATVAKVNCSPILVHLPSTPKDPRRLYFVLDLSNEALVARPSTTEHTLRAACEQACQVRSVLDCKKHSERIFSVLFGSVREAREMDGMQIMLNGPFVEAEFLPTNRPCSFFWTRERWDISEDEVVSAVSSNFWARCGEHVCTGRVARPPRSSFCSSSQVQSCYGSACRSPGIGARWYGRGSGQGLLTVNVTCVGGSIQPGATVTQDGFSRMLDVGPQCLHLL